MFYVRYILFIILLSCSSSTNVKNIRREVSSKSDKGLSCNEAVKRIYQTENGVLTDWFLKSSKAYALSYYQKKIIDLRLSKEEQILLKNHI